MVKDPVLYFDYTRDSSLANNMEEMFFIHNLRHYASSLLLTCLHDETELETAVQKAITACVVAGLPVNRHFKNIFVCAREIRKDWLVSGLALQLILLNADVSNPLVAKLQVRVLSDKTGFLHRK
jgi:hypothetical protein